jgi:hypothetical protein
VVVLFVLVVSETALPTGTGIDPQTLWEPTDLERTLTWSLKQLIPDISTPKFRAVPGRTVASPAQPWSSENHQEIVIDSQDDSDPIVGVTANIGLTSATQQAGIPESAPEFQAILGPGLDPSSSQPVLASTTTAQITCEFSNCGRTFEHRHEYQ